MKALILAGGRGSRLNELSEQDNKCMLRLADKPLIQHTLERAAQMRDIEEMIIVVGYKAERIINAFGNNYCGKTIKYVIQYEQHGLVHAIECSREAVGNSDFMLFLGDEVIVNSKHDEMMRTFKADPNLFGICGIVLVQDRSRISKTYAIMTDGEGHILRLVEKPKRPTNNLMGTGNAIFRNNILDYIERTPINHERGEKELPDLIQCAIDEGNLVQSFLVCDYYININSSQDLEEAESRLSA